MAFWPPLRLTMKYLPKSKFRANEASPLGAGPDDPVEAVGRFAYIVFVMIGSRLLSASATLGLLVACGSGSANLSASGSLNSDAAPGVGGSGSEDDAGRASNASAARDPSGTNAQTPTEPDPGVPAPAYDPKLVRQLLDETAAEPNDGRTRLGLRLAVLSQGPDFPWLIAAVNRGTESLRVLFDLRTLSLEVMPPEPPAEGKKKPRPPKATVCTLPKDVVPTRASESFELVLEPGEGVVDSFDPRLYCLPTQGVSPLVPGATVTVRLGFPEKTKMVWQKGKQEKKVLEQTPPFVARLAEVKAPEPPSAPAQQAPKAAGETAELTFERFAVKQLVAEGVELGQEYAEAASARESQSLALRLTRGSDARTEREATVTVNLLNQSDERQMVYFRRELVSFEIAGPTGLVGCNAGPDERAPERLSFITLAPGRSATATSRLIELCPPGSLRLPGLYLVHGRFEASEGGEKFGLNAFRGMIVSDKPALVRVRKGWGDLPAQKEPLRVRVGGGLPEAAPEETSQP